MHGLGFLEDAPDSRDYPFASLGLSASPPKSAGFSQHVQSVLSQGSIGSCVAQSIAQAIRTRQAVFGEADLELTSRLFIYWHSRNQHGAAKRDSGTYIREALKILNKLGKPAESLWTYRSGDADRDVDGPNPPKWSRKPPPTTLMGAVDHRRQSFYRIAETGNARVRAIKQAIASDVPVVFGTDLGESFRDHGVGYADVPKDQIIGGHAMVITEYDENGVRGPNSWGTRWGDGGFFGLTWEYMTWYKTRSLWAVDLPRLP